MVLARKVKKTFGRLVNIMFLIGNLIFVFVGSIGVYIRGYVSSCGDVNLCAYPSKVSTCGNVEPSLSLRVSGGASASLLVSHKSICICIGKFHHFTVFG